MEGFPNCCSRPPHFRATNKWSTPVRLPIKNIFFFPTTPLFQSFSHLLLPSPNKVLCLPYTSRLAQDPAHSSVFLFKQWTVSRSPHIQAGCAFCLTLVRLQISVRGGAAGPAPSFHGGGDSVSGTWASWGIISGGWSFGAPVGGGLLEGPWSSSRIGIMHSHCVCQIRTFTMVHNLFPHLLGLTEKEDELGAGLRSCRHSFGRH